MRQRESHRCAYCRAELHGDAVLETRPAVIIDRAATVRHGQTQLLVCLSCVAQGR